MLRVLCSPQNSPERGTEMTPSPLHIVLCGRSGSGKTTLAKRLLELFSDEGLQMLTSTTTREERPNDPRLPGEYEYVSESDFARMQANDEFVWTTVVGSVSYGTKRTRFEEAGQGGMYLSIITPDRLQRFKLEAQRVNQSVRILFFHLNADEPTLFARLCNRDGEEKAKARLASDATWVRDISESGVEYSEIKSDKDPEQIAQGVGSRIELMYHSLI